jgi:hypothetical protein
LTFAIDPRAHLIEPIRHTGCLHYFLIWAFRQSSLRASAHLCVSLRRSPESMSASEIDPPKQELRALFGYMVYGGNISPVDGVLNGDKPLRKYVDFGYGRSPNQVQYALVANKKTKFAGEPCLPRKC